jgi:hypothetical protein
MEKWAVICVVVQPLFDHVGWPAEGDDGWMRPESFELMGRFAAPLG